MEAKKQEGVVKEVKTMEPQEAIALLDQVCATVSLTREIHAKVLVAVSVMKNAIKNGADPTSPVDGKEGAPSGKGGGGGVADGS